MNKIKMASMYGLIGDAILETQKIMGGNKSKETLTTRPFGGKPHKVAQRPSEKQ